MNSKKKRIYVKRKFLMKKKRRQLKIRKRMIRFKISSKKSTNQNVGLMTHLSFFDEIDHEIVCILCTYTYIIHYFDIYIYI